MSKYLELRMRMENVIARIRQLAETKQSRWDLVTRSGLPQGKALRNDKPMSANLSSYPYELMKKLWPIIFISILSAATVLGLFKQPVFAASTKNTIQILLEVKEKFYQIKVTILDKNKKPIEGAKVTLYSEPVTKYTDKKGVAVFENVSQGEHRIVVEHNGQIAEQFFGIRKIGEQKVILDGQVEFYDFQIVLKQPATPLAYLKAITTSKTPFLILIIVIILLLILIFILVLKNFRIRKEKREQS